MALRALLAAALIALAPPVLSEDLPGVALVPVLEGLDAPIFLTAPAEYLFSLRPRFEGSWSTVRR